MIVRFQFIIFMPYVTKYTGSFQLIISNFKGTKILTLHCSIPKIDVSILRDLYFTTKEQWNPFMRWGQRKERIEKEKKAAAVR